MAVDLDGLSVTEAMLRAALLIVLAYFAANPSKIVDRVSFQRAWSFLILTFAIDIASVAALLYVLPNRFVEERALVFVVASAPLLCLLLGVTMLRRALLAPTDGPVAAMRHFDAPATHG
jgi:ABC-type nickel/cobalt efflux system permease component RcnA